MRISQSFKEQEEETYHFHIADSKIHYIVVNRRYLTPFTWFFGGHLICRYLLSYFKNDVDQLQAIQMKVTKQRKVLKPQLATSNVCLKDPKFHSQKRCKL